MHQEGSANSCVACAACAQGQVELIIHNDRALLALQGPSAVKVR